jgi:C4-dicarboxylate-specific signal transduction histidine kinase
MWTLWRENCLYPEEVQGSLALVLLAPLLILLYGMFGFFGLLLLFGCLGVVYLASRRFQELIRAQDSIVRSERMAAMGEMAEEIGRKMGDDLQQMRTRTAALLDAVAGADDKTRQGVQTIEVNVGRLAALVEGLAAFSHKQTEKTPTDLNHLVQSTVEFVRPQNRFDHVTFEIQADPTLPLVNVDAAQMQQVLINLLTNAADALKDVAHPVRRIEIDTRFDTNHQKVRISVADNGPGIPRDVLPRIFEPRFTTKATGHGYGLSLAFRIAANHRGTIRASNRQNGGAQFLMEIPNL